MWNACTTCYTCINYMANINFPGPRPGLEKVRRPSQETLGGRRESQKPPARLRQGAREEDEGDERVIVIQPQLSQLCPNFIDCPHLEFELHRKPDIRYPFVLEKTYLLYDFVLYAIQTYTLDKMYDLVHGETVP